MRMVMYVFVIVGFIMASSAFAATHEEANMQEKADNVILNITYPIFENPVVNQDIQRWASSLGENFWAENRDDASSIPIPFEFVVTHTVTRPSSTVLSIAWNIASYTGGAHGNVEIVTMSYDMIDGILLDPLNLFDKPDIALQRMSNYAFAMLSNTLGDMHDDSMLQAGIEPVLENFSAISLTPLGLRIYFQPYQVAPWAAGPQEVNVPLSALKDAQPDLIIWAKPALYYK